MALYCKIDAFLDANPKIRKAGRFGREVYQFLLRRNRVLDAHGKLPIGNCDPKYLSDQLQMPESEAVEGLEACVLSGLIAYGCHEMSRRERDMSHDEKCKRDKRDVSRADFVSILGWSEEWSREPKNAAQRKAEQRARERESFNNNELQDSTKKCHEMSRDKRDCHESHVREEKRREELKEEEYAARAARQTSKPAEPETAEPGAAQRARRSRRAAGTGRDAVLLPLGPLGGAEQENAARAQPIAFGEVGENSRGPHEQVTKKWFDRFEAHTNAKPTWGSAQGAQLKRLLSAHSSEELCRRIDNAYDAPPFPYEPPADFLAFVRGIDKYAIRYERNQQNRPNSQPAPTRPYVVTPGQSTPPSPQVQREGIEF